MMTPTQKRALRAQTLLDSGMDPREAAKECGYKNVNGMMGAIALCLRKLPDEDKQTEIERMREEDQKEAQSASEVPARTGEYTKPGIYELEGKGEVLVGERMPKKDWEDIRKRQKENARMRFAERHDEAHAETRRVGLRYCKNDKTGEVEFRIHVFGIDKWIVVNEENVGGKEELLRILRDTANGLKVILEGIA